VEVIAPTKTYRARSSTNRRSRFDSAFGVVPALLQPPELPAPLMVYSRLVVGGVGS